MKAEKVAHLQRVVKDKKRDREMELERERDGDVQQPYLTNFSLRFMQKGRIQRMLSCFISRITVL